MKVMNLDSYDVKDLLDPSLSKSDKIIYRNFINTLSDDGFIKNEFILTESNAHKIIAGILGDANLQSRLHDELYKSQISNPANQHGNNNEHEIDPNIELVASHVNAVCNGSPMSVVMWTMRIVYDYIRQKIN